GHHLFSGRRDFRRSDQTDFEVAGEALRNAEAEGVDKVASALSVAGTFLRPRHFAGADKTSSRLSGGDRTIDRSRTDIRRRRGAQARPRRTPVLPDAQQVDADSRLRLGVRTLCASESLADRNRRLATRSVLAQSGGRSSARVESDCVSSVRFGPSTL